MAARGEALSKRLSAQRELEQNAQARIDAQTLLVAQLKPGSQAHRTATGVLLLFKDSLHALNEAHALLAWLHERRA